MSHHYLVPTVGDGVHGDPTRPLDYDSVDGGSEDHNLHYVDAGGAVVVAAHDEVPVYEEAADDAESVVTRLDPDEGEHPTPDPVGADDDDGADESGDEFPCDDPDCDRAFDSQAGLNSHSRVHD